MVGTNADLIREAFKEVGQNHSNKYMQEYIREKHKRIISISQIAAVLGRYRDRDVLASPMVQDLCRRLLLACRNDLGLVRKVLASYG